MDYSVTSPGVIVFVFIKWVVCVLVIKFILFGVVFLSSSLHSTYTVVVHVIHLDEHCQLSAVLIFIEWCVWCSIEFKLC